MEHDPNDPMCKCQKCMDMSMKADGCTPDSADCNDPMCKMCARKFWNGSAFEGKL